MLASSINFNEADVRKNVGSLRAPVSTISRSFLLQPASQPAFLASARRLENRLSEKQWGEKGRGGGEGESSRLKRMEMVVWSLND